jgi:hypothetical protein
MNSYLFWFRFRRENEIQRERSIGEYFVRDPTRIRPDRYNVASYSLLMGPRLARVLRVGPVFSSGPGSVSLNFEPDLW